VCIATNGDIARDDESRGKWSRIEKRHNSLRPMITVRNRTTLSPRFSTSVVGARRFCVFANDGMRSIDGFAIPETTRRTKEQRGEGGVVSESNGNGFAAQWPVDSHLIRLSVMVCLSNGSGRRTAAVKSDVRTATPGLTIRKRTIKRYVHAHSPPIRDDD
jgi:hypothetical protein